ncbi:MULTISPECIES: ATP-binding protein [Catenuloplanes]|uniref:AAA+ ATPase superfamily predicted ATPase n=1 Tax=Catenuloplanes niger TaxID=587534 RepID=A0AAE4CUF4_9ACTN|nr:ATP-binding protein [Catenuloplanes niger]MDR7326291.1 AAA+ ATPase superfamily predicted ATPase [Catenuloplanes niger]
MALSRPAGMFDREREWRALTAFATDPAPGATLGVVSGRRRQGKTYLLRALCAATGGFYFGADEATDRDSLNRLGAALAEHGGAPAPFVFDGWHTAIDALLALGRERRVPVVIDEFPYLARANPQLPSIVQNAFAPLRPERDDSRAALLLCGSAMSFMGKLLSGNAPLRGRAGLELVVPTLDHRLAAEFWEVADPVTALRVNAIVGGTPAYRREFVRDDTPAGPDDFDDWVLRTVLSPTSPLFREARYLLADEPELHDISLYHSVLAAIASGNAQRGGIASYLGRKSSDLAHPLNVLEDSGLVTREPDVFRDNRTTFRIAEPLVTFYHAVMRPIWSDLEHTRDATRLWQRSQRRFLGSVLGPHFEQVCRSWARHMAPPDLFGDYPNVVGTGAVHDPAGRTSHQVDVVVFGLDDDDRRPLLAIGEAKWGERMGLGHLDRLRRIRTLLTAQGRFGAEHARLACFSGVGFHDDLLEAARRDDSVVLVTAADLYRS